MEVIVAIKLMRITVGQVPSFNNPLYYRPYNRMFRKNDVKLFKTNLKKSHNINKVFTTQSKKQK